MVHSISMNTRHMPHDRNVITRADTHNKQKPYVAFTKQQQQHYVLRTAVGRQSLLPAPARHARCRAAAVIMSGDLLTALPAASRCAPYI